MIKGAPASSKIKIDENDDFELNERNAQAVLNQRRAQAAVDTEFEQKAGH